MSPEAFVLSHPMHCPRDVTDLSFSQYLLVCDLPTLHRQALLTGDAEVEALKDRLGAGNMPEQLFGDSYLRLTHTSGAAAELQCCGCPCGMAR